MLRTKNMVTSISEVPDNWIFENYLNLSEMLNGQDVNIKSIFNARDRKPSFYIFMSRTENKYFWKDFSAGKSGDSVELVRELNNLTYRFEAETKVISDYNNYLQHNAVPSREYTEGKKPYQVTQYKTRGWNTDDMDYWTKFKIGSQLLEHYNVVPLLYFKICREGQEVNLTIRNRNIYGYFTNSGELYKIYQPLNPEYKFFKVKSYIQGSEQLTGKQYLVICSSLKDLMAFNLLGFKNAEAIAPDSENVMIPKEFILDAMHKYEGICTILDNDQAGINAMQRYRELYGIPNVLLKYEKDVADSVKTYGIESTRIHLQRTLSHTLKNSKQIYTLCDFYQ